MTNNNNQSHHYNALQGDEYNNQWQTNPGSAPIFPSQLLPPQGLGPAHQIVAPPPPSQLIPSQQHWAQQHEVPLEDQPGYQFQYTHPQGYLSQLFSAQNYQQQLAPFPSQPTEPFQSQVHLSLTPPHPLPHFLQMSSFTRVSPADQQVQNQQAGPQQTMPQQFLPNQGYGGMFVNEQHGMPVAHIPAAAATEDPEEGLYKQDGTSIIAPGSVSDSNGRTYQGYREGKYFLPNDPKEQDRLDFQHAGTQIVLHERLAWAPIQSPKFALDVATGTGIWASDFAAENPDCEVVGSDLTPIQPSTSVANVQFVIEDAEDPWIYDHKFDYIHARYVYTCFDNPRVVIRSAFEFLNPGGYLEFQDVSPLLRSAKGPDAIADNPLRRLIDLAVNGAALQGRDILVAQHYKRWLEEAGFVDVREEKVGLPINEWHPNDRLKRAGLYHSRMMMDNLRGLAWKMVQGNGLSDAEIEELIVQVKPEYRNLDIQGYYDFYVVYGRKPYDSEVSYPTTSSQETKQG